VKTRFLSAILCMLASIAGVRADVFGNGSNQFSIAFVEVGFPSNAPKYYTAWNTTNQLYAGSVSNIYRIGATEISVDQFDKAMAADNRISHIDGTTNHHDYTYWNIGERNVGPGAPAAYVNWYEAARFANWLTSGDAYAGAYQFDTNGTLVAVDRNAALATYGRIYVLPTENEWFKAAYYKPVNDGSYAVHSDGVSEPPNSYPIWGTTNGFNYSTNWSWDGAVNAAPDYMWESGYGGLEQNGTYDMCGNVFEWCESAWDGQLDDMFEGRVIRGGSAKDAEIAARFNFRHGAYSPTNEHELVGFRVASLPVGMYSLSVAVSGSGSVNATNGWYDADTNLSLSATPDAGWLFMEWTGDITGDYTTASTNLLMNGDKSITAVFSDDADGDGLLNSSESSLGTDPRNADTDSDGLSDGNEVNTYGTDPLASDSDTDGLNDGNEVNVR